MIAFCLLTPLLVHLNPKALQQPQQVARNTWSVKYEYGKGRETKIAVQFDSLTIIQGVKLRISEWTETDQSPDVTVSQLDTMGKRIIIRHRYTNGAGAEERYDVKSNGAVTAHLEVIPGNLKSVSIDWAAAEIDGAALSGTKWSAEGVDYSSPKGAISEKRYEGDFANSIIAQKFWTLDANNSNWKLRFAPGQESPDAILADGKPANGDWPMGERRFWLGFVGVKTIPGETLVRTIRMDLIRVYPPKISTKP